MSETHTGCWAFESLQALTPRELRRLKVACDRAAAEWLLIWHASERAHYVPAVTGGDLGRYMRFALYAADVGEALERVISDQAYSRGFQDGGADAQAFEEPGGDWPSRTMLLDAWENERTGERDADRG